MELREVCMKLLSVLLLILFIGCEESSELSAEAKSSGFVSDQMPITDYRSDCVDGYVYDFEVMEDEVLTNIFVYDNDGCDGDYSIEQESLGYSEFHEDNKVVLIEDTTYEINGLEVVGRVLD